MEERVALVRKSKLTKQEAARLKVLDATVDNLSSAESSEDQEAMDVIRRAAVVLRQGKKSK
jgi:hypothetical protein